MAHNMFAPQPTRNKPILEFRAGKMLIRGKQVIPDTRKGLIQLIQSPEDGLIHFLWKDRGTQQIETDLIIFPGDAVYKRVKQCTTGRVYLLEWKTSDRRMFFWMQEPSDEKDDEYCQKINNTINNPPQPDAGGGGTGAGLGGIDQSQLLAMMGGAGRRAAGGAGRTASRSPAPEGPSQARAAPSSSSSHSPAPSQSGISNEQLSSILSGLGVDTAQVPSPSSQRQGGAENNLSAIMNPEALIPLLNDPAIQEQLLPLLPEGNRSPEDIAQLIRSPQFLQAVGQLNSALQSGQLREFMPLFGLPASAGGTQGGVQALLSALQEQYQEQPAATPPTASDLPPLVPSQQQEDTKPTDTKKDDDDDKKDDDKKDGDKMDESS